MATGNSSRIRQALRLLLGTIAAALLIAVFYVAVVLGQPQPNEHAVAVRTDQPLLSASPAQTLASEGELESLMAAFPVPVLYAQSGGAQTADLDQAQQHGLTKATEGLRRACHGQARYAGGARCGEEHVEVGQPYRAGLRKRKRQQERSKPDHAEKAQNDDKPRGHASAPHAVSFLSRGKTNNDILF